MNKLLNHLLGPQDIWSFIACLLFALVGITISLLIHATNRYKESEKSPYKFSFSFLIKDNWQRILLNILLILMTIRFCKEITGLDLNMFVALLIGMAYDKLAEWLRNKCIIDKK